jgi:BirA family biotin operon repressor/biotin-[acetyl-CoA-carboxylase] ligase
MSLPHLPAVFRLQGLACADGARQEARRQAMAGAGDGLWLQVQRQTQGEARDGRLWVSPAQGLYAALVLEPEPGERVAEWPLVLLAALGRAVAEQVAPMTDLRYRWPNDLLVGGAKVAGLWLDRGRRADGRPWAVLSLAVNVGAPPGESLPDGACLALDGGAPELSPEALLEGLARQLLAGFESWQRQGLAPTLRHLLGRGLLPAPDWRARAPAPAAPARAIDAQGNLQLAGLAAPLTLEQFFLGEVEASA